MSISHPSAFSSRRSACRTSGWSSASRIRALCRTSLATVVACRRGVWRHQSFTSQPSFSRTTRCAVGGVHLGVRDLDDGRAFGVELLEQLHDLAALIGVQVAGRLVGQDDRRLRDERARDGDQLLLSAGELRRVEVLLADDLEAVEHVADQAVALLLLDVAIGERHVEVFVHRQVVQQVIGLEHEADVLLLQVGAVALAQRVNRLAVQEVLAGPRGVVHAQDVQQRRLAGAGRPHDRDELAGLEVERHAAQHVRALHAGLVRLLDVLETDDRVHRDCRCRQIADGREITQTHRDRILDRNCSAIVSVPAYP